MGDMPLATVLCLCPCRRANLNLVTWFFSHLQYISIILHGPAYDKASVTSSSTLAEEADSCGSVIRYKRNRVVGRRACPLRPAYLTSVSWLLTGCESLSKGLGHFMPPHTSILAPPTKPLVKSPPLWNNWGLKKEEHNYTAMDWHAQSYTLNMQTNTQNAVGAQINYWLKEILSWFLSVYLSILLNFPGQLDDLIFS